MTVSWNLKMAEQLQKQHEVSKLVTPKGGPQKKTSKRDLNMSK